MMMVAPAFSQSRQPQVVDKIVAVVGKNIILQSDIESQYLQQRLAGDASGTALALRCEILESLLLQKLMLNQAEMDSISVTDDQVEVELNRRIQYFVSRMGSQEKLEEYFSKSPISMPSGCGLISFGLGGMMSVALSNTYFLPSGSWNVISA